MLAHHYTSFSQRHNSLLSQAIPLSRQSTRSDVTIVRTSSESRYAVPTQIVCMTIHPIELLQAEASLLRLFCACIDY